MQPAHREASLSVQWLSRSSDGPVPDMCAQTPCSASVELAWAAGASALGPERRGDQTPTLGMRLMMSGYFPVLSS